MFQQQEVKVILLQSLMFLASLPKLYDCLIITSVLAGDKKFKTISFDCKFLKPLTFESELPTTEFRRHRTLRPPKFDIDVNIPIKLPLEDEYAYEEPRKPVESDIFFQTSEIKEPSYGGKQSNGGYTSKKINYQEGMAYAASQTQPMIYTDRRGALPNNEENLRSLTPNQAQVAPRFSQLASQPRQMQVPQRASARSDVKDVSAETTQQQVLIPAESANVDEYSRGGYAQPAQYKNNYQPEFIPGGFVNLQLSGPTGGPKPTYADYDRERWAQQLSQAAGAMPYPILNYHQLQNFYGGLGTFTNGLADNRYVSDGILDKFKAGLSHFKNKFHFG